MTKNLELRTFLHKEVFKTKNILQLPTRRKRKGPHSPSVVPQKSTSRDLLSHKSETPVEKFIHADIPPNKLPLSKEKSETRLRIEELREQLLQVIAKSHESSDARNEAARERERLIREIEVLEVQERVRRGNALRGMESLFLCSGLLNTRWNIELTSNTVATGNLPEPISQSEKKHIQKEGCRVQRAIEGKEVSV
jgi:hypothetical protein